MDTDEVPGFHKKLLEIFGLTKISPLREFVRQSVITITHVAEVYRRVTPRQRNGRSRETETRRN